MLPAGVQCVLSRPKEQQFSSQKPKAIHRFRFHASWRHSRGVSGVPGPPPEGSVFFGVSAVSLQSPTLLITQTNYN